MGFSVELSQLKGIGPATINKLAKLGIEQAYDLLFWMPLRYEDKTRISEIKSLHNRQITQIQGVVVKSYVMSARRSILVCEISDGTGVVNLKFFHHYYSQRVRMKPGSIIRAYGEVHSSVHGFDMVHPQYQHLKSQQDPLDRYLTPVYPTTSGLSQKLLRSLIKQILQCLSDKKLYIHDYLPEEYLQSEKLPDLTSAIRIIHQPDSRVDPQELLSWQHSAQRRLILEELLAHVLHLKKIKKQISSFMAPVLSITHEHLQGFKKLLGFQLTIAQSRVINEILVDLALNTPMQRLLQGDVGSGKTVVAAAAIQAAFMSGHQSVLMAPTELLAEQHMRSLKKLFPNDRLVFLSGSLKKRERKKALKSIQEDADIIVGTHALFQDGVNYRSLALVIIDEQHRFGVQQRLKLKQKGQQGRGDYHPHILIMTATPIPRTLAQTAYANLDVSIIDELPPQRKVINTVLLSNKKMSELAQRVKQVCTQGGQAYWVCSLVEESENSVAMAAEERLNELRQWFPDLNIALIHGKLSAEQKYAAMLDFIDNKVKLLVATTVIEVGVDVPNASLMIIENAERFGLSQLHQLRGRVGRGSTQSHCVLMYQPPLSTTAQTRLQTLRETNDGFIIAKQDLKLRGPGELLGARQTGAMAFRLVDLQRDHELVKKAQNLAEKILEESPDICDHIINRWNSQQQELAKI